MKISMRGIPGKCLSLKAFIAFRDGVYWDGTSDVFTVNFYEIIEEDDWFREEVRNCTKRLSGQEGTRRYKKYMRNARLEKLGRSPESKHFGWDDLPI